MANVSVYNMEGAEVGTMELSDAIFGLSEIGLQEFKSSALLEEYLEKIKVK